MNSELNKCKCGSDKEPCLDSDDMVPSWIAQCFDCKQEQHGSDWSREAAIKKWNKENPVKEEKSPVEKEKVSEKNRYCFKKKNLGKNVSRRTYN